MGKADVTYVTIVHNYWLFRISILKYNRKGASMWWTVKRWVHFSKEISNYERLKAENEHRAIAERAQGLMDKLDN